MLNEDLTLLERLKKAKIVQVLVVYLGASWVVLQIADVLQNTAGLPEWVGAFTLLLLLIGLVIILATAWVQSLNTTTAKERAGEIPTDWEIAPADVLDSLKSGKLPHLTWGRAILGGVMALSLLFGGAGVYVLLTGGSGLLGPTEAGADEAAAGIAVLPFDARGEELAIYREGMVDLLSASFDGVGGYRTIDSRTVLARWEEEVGDATRPDLDAALRAAGRTGARYALLGSMVPAGTQVRVSVDIYDVGDGSLVGKTQIDGSPEEIFALVDGLSVGIARELLGTSGEQVASERLLENITTNDVDALRDYLEGERLYRVGDFQASSEAFERAVAADSTFALAWARLAASLGWVADGGVRSRDARDRAVNMADRLSPREAQLNRARSLYNHGDPAAIPILQDYTQRYPDDAEAWYDLGDSYYHMTIDQVGRYAASRAEAWGALRKAAELDPSFSPYQIHLVDFAFSAGDSAEARAAIDAYREASGADNQFSNVWDAGFAVLFGDDATMREGIAAALELPEPMNALGLIGSGQGVDLAPRELALARALAEARGEDETFARLAQSLMHAGRWQESQALYDRVEGDVDPLMLAGQLMGWQYAFSLGDADRVHEFLSGAGCVAGAPDCLGLALARAQHGALAGHEEELRQGLASLEGARDAVLALPGFAENPAVMSVVTGIVDQAPMMVDLASGDAQAAYEGWVRFAGDGSPDHAGFAWAADQVGDVETAERYYLAAAWRAGGSLATYRLARMYDRLGRDDDALVQYRRLAMMWAEADDDFQPWVEVQTALARMGG